MHIFVAEIVVMNSRPLLNPLSADGSRHLVHIEPQARKNLCSVSPTMWTACGQNISGHPWTPLLSYLQLVHAEHVRMASGQEGEGCQLSLADLRRQLATH